VSQAPPIQSPAQLKGLGLAGLRSLADELRQVIIGTCLRNGGHLGASLGTVELAIALHYVFESPREPIVWDVGHQAYAHKLLTGRWASFATLRQRGGISGFLSRAESEHDVFGAGHSSTALSAALAMAYARTGKPDWTVAVIGDGGLTAGVALEALNNARATAQGPLLVVLNDNQMSIAANVGALSQIFASERAAEFFELFGFEYAARIDGHNLAELIGTLEAIRARPGTRPVLLHVLTQKGKGYAPAEESPATYHGIGPAGGKVAASAQGPAPKQMSCSEAFGSALCRIAARDPRVVAITAAMPEGTGLLEFARRFPERFFDVGIAEPHAVTFAAGLATQGYRPVVAIYSTFLQRGLDAVIHDVALQGLGVTLTIDRAGLVGADGPTHHGAFDLAYLGMIPGLTVSAPAALPSIESELEAAIASGRPWAIRYPRGTLADSLGGEFIDGIHWLTRPANARLLCVGLGPAALRLAQAARAAAPGSVAVMAVEWAKPLDAALIAQLRQASGVPLWILEDGSRRGGFGEALAAELGARPAPVEILGYPDEFVPHGTLSELEEALGISVRALEARLREQLA
jgi:1-deoxy-D-xylulose-5-phosphate synthase